MKMLRTSKPRSLLLATVISGIPLITSLFYLLSVPFVSASGSGSVVSLGLNTVLSMNTTPAGSLSIPISPTTASVYSSRKLSVNVATNNPTGYTMTFSTLTASNVLTNSAASTNNTLATTGGGVTTPSALALNAWGFAVPMTQTNSAGLFPSNTSGFDSTYSEQTSVAAMASKYAAVPASTSPLTLKTTSIAANSDNTDLYFGARVDLTKPAGSYQGTIIFSVVGNYSPPEAPTTMQGMTASYCAGMSAGATLNLTDVRDNNIYTIAKIGTRCWMAQNLALGNTGGTITLTPDNSNVASNWTLSAPITNGTASGTDSAQWIPANANGNNYCAPTGTAKCGNLYNWYAATAGTGTTSVSSGNATASICPANWYLPTGGTTTTTDFAQLDIALGGTGTSGSRDSSYLTNPPFSAVLSGFYHFGLSLQGVGGYFWSSTALSSGYAYYSYFDPSYVTPGDADVSTYYGLSLRCVLSL